MISIADETLMAYVDGELEAGDAARVEAALVADASLRARAARFKATRTPVQAVFDDVLREPVPGELLALVRGHAASATTGAVGSVSIAARARPATARAAGTGWSPMRLAAGVALLLAAGGAGWLLRSGTATEQGAAPHSRFAATLDTLQQVLETEPSGTRRMPPLAFAAGDAVAVNSTFVGRSSRYCRHYAVSFGGAPFEGVACRADRGEWVIEAHMHQVSPATRRNRGGPASGPENPVAQSIDALMSGGVLDEAEERLLLQSGWAAKLPPR